MPYFLILADDRPDAVDDRLARRGEHLAYWTAMSDVVKVAGAMLDGEQPRGSALLLEATDEDAARALVAADPFAQVGIFADDIRVIAIRPAIGEWLPAA